MRDKIHEHDFKNRCHAAARRGRARLRGGSPRNPDRGNAHFAGGVRRDIAILRKPGAARSSPRDRPQVPGKLLWF